MTVLVGFYCWDKGHGQKQFNEEGFISASKRPGHNSALTEVRAGETTKGAASRLDGQSLLNPLS